MSERTRERLLLGVILLLTFAVRMWDLGRNGLWYDEILQAQAVVGTLDEFINQLIVHAAMPLDYAIERRFLLLGHNELWLRFPAAAFGTLAVAVIYKFGRAMFGKTTGVVAAAFLAVSPFAVLYAHEARPYSLYMLLILTAFYWLYRALQTNRLTHWLYFGISLAGATLTHLFALFCILALALYVVLGLLVRTIAPKRARLFARITRTAILGGVVVAGLFLAALWLTPNAQFVWGSSLRFFRFLLSPQFASPDLWNGLAPGETPPLLTFDFFYTRILENFSGGGVVATTAFVGLGLAGLSAARHKSWEIFLLGLWAILPSAFIVLFLGDRGTLFAARYLIASVPPWLVLCAVGTVQVGALLARFMKNNRAVRRATIALVSIAFVVISFQRTAIAVALVKEDWRAAGALLEANVGAQDAVITPGGTGVVYFYAPNTRARRNGAETGAQIARVEQQAERVWLVMNRYVYDPGGEILAWLEGRGALGLQVDDGITLYYWRAGADNAALLSEAQSLHLPPSTFVYVSLARALAFNGDTDAADAHLRRAASFAKSDAERVMVNLAWGEALRGAGRADEAAEKYRASLGLDATRTQAWIGLGRVYLDQDQLLAAHDALARALALEPNSYPALFFLAEYYERSGQDTAAQEYYERAAQIIPELITPP